MSKDRPSIYARVGDVEVEVVGGEDDDLTDVSGEFYYALDYGIDAYYDESNVEADDTGYR